MMNLRHIEVFHAVYTHGSVSAAARALNVAQPSVSKVLRHAESRVGFALFHRSRGRLIPTEEARTLFREVDDIYTRVASLRQASLNIGRSINGLVRLAVMPGFGLDVAPRAVAEFRRKFPSMSVDIQTIHHADIPRALVERDCDIAISYDPMQHHARLTNEQIGRGQLVLLYREGTIQESPDPIPLEVLEQLDFISLVHSGPLGVIFNSAMEHLEVKTNEVVTVNTMYIAASLVRQGLGVALVDDFTARACAEPDLRFRPVEPALGFGVYCVHLGDRPLSRLTKSFIQILRAAMPGDE